jgi:hypothetical protein
MFTSWTPAKLDHAIACAERASDRRAHTKGGSYTLEQLRKARAPTFPLPPFTTEAAYKARHAKPNKDELESMLEKLFGW